MRLVANGRSIPAPKRHSPAPTMEAHSKGTFEHAPFRLRFVRPAPSLKTFDFRSQDSQNWRVLAFWNWINLKSSLSSLLLFIHRSFQIPSALTTLLLFYGFCKLPHILSAFSLDRDCLWQLLLRRATKVNSAFFEARTFSPLARNSSWLRGFLC